MRLILRVLAGLVAAFCLLLFSLTIFFGGVYHDGMVFPEMIGAVAARLCLAVAFGWLALRPHHITGPAGIFIGVLLLYGISNEPRTLYERVYPLDSPQRIGVYLVKLAIYALAILTIYRGLRPKQTIAA